MPLMSFLHRSDLLDDLAQSRMPIGCFEAIGKMSQFMPKLWHSWTMLHLTLNEYNNRLARKRAKYVRNM